MRQPGKRCSSAQAAVNRIAYVDTIDVCNLKCPTCIRGLRGMPNSGKKMTLEQFDRIVGKVASEGYKTVGLFDWTEPFLNQNLHEYISIVKRHDLWCIVSTNFSLRRIPGLEAALRSGIDHLIVSVSGFEQEVYEVNHVAGDIAYVKDNLRRASEIKARQAAPVLIVLRFLKFSYNHDEEEKLKRFASGLGIEFEVIEGVGDPMHPEPIRSNEWVEGVLRSYRGERPYDQPGKVCPLIFGEIPMDYSGKVYLCCAYPSHDALAVGS